MEKRAGIQIATSENARYSASKYDFVKVKVWVGENFAHYYILSRFLISRMLTVTRIPQMKAVKIALEVKKYLVDNDFLDISQDHLEAILFNVMRTRGFEDEYIKRYKMVTKFFQQRRPLIVLICGVPCTRKSTLAQQLASRLNMPNVLQTDAIYELMRMSEDGPVQPTPLWERQDLSPSSVVREFLRECRIVRKGLDGSLIKCIADGKSIIIEGMHLDPGLYLYEFGHHGQAHLRDNGLHSNNGSLRTSLPTQAATKQQAPLQTDTKAAEGNKEQTEGLRVPMRTTSADTHLHATCSRVRLPARRSASFMLSPTSAGGHMSAVLASASALRAASGEQLERPGAGSVAEHIPRDCLGPAHASTAAPLAGDDPSATAFLSMSPTMQWLQMASKTSCSEGPSLPSAALGDQGACESVQFPAHLGQHADAARQCADHLDSPAAVASSSSRVILSGSAEVHASTGIEPKLFSVDGQQGTCPEFVAPETSSLSSRLRLSSRETHADRRGVEQAGADPNAGLSRLSSQIISGTSTAVPSDKALQQRARNHGAMEEQQLKDAAYEHQSAGAVSSSEEDLKPGPVFVPIVLCMDDADHELLVEEWHASHLGSAKLTPEEIRSNAQCILERLRNLQTHLYGYEMRAVPVVKLELANFNQTLDRLHDYLLLCIQMAMEQQK